MRLETRNVLLKAYAQLHRIIADLYDAHDTASANDYDEDASLLVGERIDFMKKRKIFIL
ncbi:hypothetical protein [Scytonema sp. NUACC26]|uniref:hypothetical protein n=1 Tax=Scytonema sp. NUACC26 TaxID=3140176 RepID=UPI0034DB9960